MKNIDTKSLIIGFLSCALILTIMGFNGNNENIRCKSITIINDNKEEIAYLGNSIENSGILYLNNKSGKEVAYLGSNEWGGGIISINNKFNERVVYLGEDDQSSGLFHMHNKFGTVALSAGVDTESNSGMIDFANNRGNLMGRFVVVDNQGVLITLDANGNITGSIPIE